MQFEILNLKISLFTLHIIRQSKSNLNRIGNFLLYLCDSQVNAV